MNSEKNPGSNNTENSELETEGKEAGLEDGVPLSVRKAREIRIGLWPYCWMSFASIVFLAAALAILSYRIGVQTCH
jgi:hypothetical protein